MSGFYKMDPAAWDFGTAELTLEQEAAYLRIINAIHKHDQPVPDNDRVLAGMFRCSTRRARSLVQSLIEAGKIRVENGRLTNDRAVSDMVQRGFVSSSRAEAGAKGGRTRAERAAKRLTAKDQAQACASSRIEENRIEYGGGGGSARESAAIDTPPSPPELPPPEPLPPLEPTLLERVCAAAGLPIGQATPSGRVLGSPSDGIEVRRWLDLGLDPDTILAEVAHQMLGKRDGPPSSLSYFTRGMTRLAGRLAVPRLIPITGGRGDDDPPSARPHGSHRDDDLADAAARRYALAARLRGPQEVDFGDG